MPISLCLNAIILFLLCRIGVEERKGSKYTGGIYGLSFQRWSSVGHLWIKAVVDVENMVHFFPINNLAAAWLPGFFCNDYNKSQKIEKRQQLDGEERKKGGKLKRSKRVTVLLVHTE